MRAAADSEEQARICEAARSAGPNPMSQVKIFLDESEIPANWYNVVADMPKPPAPLLGADGKPIGPESLAAIFPPAIIEQEISRERWIPIPEPVREIYRQWRPTPMFRARRLEEALGTPAKIYYKYEGVSPAGSHKPNTSVPQAYYNRLAGVTPSRPRPARANGVRRSRWRVRCSVSRFASIWCASATSRNRFAAR